MHTLGDGKAIGRDDVQFKRVLINLGEQGRRRNGERKRVGGFAHARERCGPFAHRHQFRFACEAMHRSAHLIVGGQYDRLPRVCR